MNGRTEANDTYSSVSNWSISLIEARMAYFSTVPIENKSAEFFYYRLRSKVYEKQCSIF
jgi:hypothetical protein